MTGPTDPSSAGEKAGERFRPAARADRYRLVRRYRRTGVLGLAASGKSVFITSLLDRIRRSDGARVPLAGRGVRIPYLGEHLAVTRQVTRLPPVAEGDGGFPLDRHRDYLGDQFWPDKTVARSEYRYRVSLTSGHRALGALLDQYAEERVIVDIPGERLADLMMAGRDYATWSDRLLDDIEADRRWRAYAGPYLELLASGQVEERRAVAAYKAVLARFTRELVPLVCPSAFLVPEQGQHPASAAASHEMPEGELVARGVAGLDAATEFAPLSAAARIAHPGLVETFARRYTAYRRAVVEKVGHDFLDCDDLLVLVDVCGILGSGPAALRATRRVLERMLEYLDPGQTARERMVSAFAALATGGRRGRLGAERLGIIAPKADLVHSKDRALLRKLLGDLVQPLLDRRPGKQLAVSLFYCAAIKACEDGSEYPRLRAWVLAERGDEASPRRYVELPVPALPGEWPAEDEWPPGALAFPEVEPPRGLALLGRTPFPSIGLEEIMEFIGCASSAHP